MATIFRLSASAPLAAPAANDPTCLCGRRCVRCPDCSRSTPLVESAFESKPGVTLIMVDIGDKQNWWDAAPTHSAVFPGVHSCSGGQFLQARPRERPPSGDGAIRRQMPTNGAPARRKAGHRSRKVQGVRIPTGTTRYIPAAPFFALPVWPRPCSCVECSQGSHGGPSARGRVPGDAPLLVFHECTVAHNGTHCQRRRDFPRFCCSCKDGTAVVNVCICVGNFRNLK